MSTPKTGLSARPTLPVQGLSVQDPTTDMPRRPSDAIAFDWNGWASLAKDGPSQEDRERIAHVFRNALNYPHIELTLSVLSPKACSHIPLDAMEEWAKLRSAATNDDKALTKIELPRGMKKLPAWLQAFPKLQFLGAQDFKGDVKQSEDDAQNLCPGLFYKNLNPPVSTSSVDDCVEVVGAWSLPKPGESPEDAAPRTAIASILIQMMMHPMGVLKLPASAVSAFDKLDLALLKTCIEAKEARGHRAIDRIEATGLKTLPKWLGACTNLSRLKLTDFKGAEVDLRALPRSVALELDGSEKELLIHSFGSTVAKELKDPQYTHNIYLPGDDSQRPHTILRSGQANSNGATSYLGSWFDSSNARPIEIVCADLNTWVLLQWISQPAVAGTDEFLQQLNSPESIQRTVKPGIRELHRKISESLPKNDFMNRKKWGEFVAQRLQGMAVGQSEEFKLASVRHSMSMQLSKTEHGLTVKLYDPNRTVQLTQRSLHISQLDEITSWAFDETLLRPEAERSYFADSTNKFGAEGPDPHIKATLVPKDFLARCAEPAPDDRHLSFEFGPTTFSEAHVSVMRHIMRGRHLDALQRMKSEVEQKLLPANRVLELLEWRDAKGYNAARYVKKWPEAGPIIKELRALAELEE